MAAEPIQIEVAYATPDKQIVIPLTVAADCTIHQAILASGILTEFPEIDLKRQKTGIFSHVYGLTKIVSEGDRVEIYRPLLLSPMEARRKRL